MLMMRIVIVVTSSMEKRIARTRIVTRFTFSMPESTTALLTTPMIDQSLIPTGSYTK